jgi:hypothetical protein
MMIGTEEEEKLFRCAKSIRSEATGSEIRTTGIHDVVYIICCKYSCVQLIQVTIIKSRLIT